MSLPIPGVNPLPLQLRELSEFLLNAIATLADEDEEQTRLLMIDLGMQAGWLRGVADGLLHNIHNQWGGDPSPDEEDAQ